MAIESVYWESGAGDDLHLVPGLTSPRLDHQLWIKDSVAGLVRADAPPPGVVVTLAPNFPTGPGTAGVAVSPTGGVTVTAPLPVADRLLNFLIMVTVKEGAAGAKLWTWRRFFIHRDIVRIWLTPETLTVRQDAGNTRFTLLAEFDDGTYGDLTPWCPRDTPSVAAGSYVRLTNTPGPAITWISKTTSIVAVDSGTGLLVAAANSGTANIWAHIGPPPPPPAVGPPPPLPVKSAALGFTHAAVPWSTPVPVIHIDGRPGFDGMGSAANVLILPDGFVDDPNHPGLEKLRFEGLARQLVHQLRTRQRTRPFDVLRDKLNYFMAWIPSREAGISTLPTVERSKVVGRPDQAVEVETATEKGFVPLEWSIPVTNTRFLLNERDTAFHTAFGNRPRAKHGDELRSVGGHPLRFDDGAFNDFLGALRKPSGGAVGAAWASGGRDEDRIIILCRSLRDGGSNNPRQPTGRYICMTLGERDHHEIEDHLSDFGKDLLPDSIPARMDLESVNTAAHELGHSLMLGNEYGGDDEAPTDANTLEQIAKWTNIQARATLIKGGDLHADEIKWRWPRIEKAGVLKARLPSGGGYRVVLEGGHGKPFVKGDVVRLRLRPLITAGRHSDRFIVDNEVTGDELQLMALVAPPFVPGNFQPGSVLFAAVRGPDPNPADHIFGEDLQLVHEGTVARINATHNPLNALDKALPNRGCPGEAKTPTPATNFLDGKAPKPPHFSSWIVGLYENGDGFNCDVYRPTGVCLMREHHLFVDPTKSTESSYQFCTVCRYVIVDLLDPTLHGLMDEEYEPRYPK
jgi:hypothetical protein